MPCARYAIYVRIYRIHIYSQLHTQSHAQTLYVMCAINSRVMCDWRRSLFIRGDQHLCFRGTCIAINHARHNSVYRTYELYAQIAHYIPKAEWCTAANAPHGLYMPNSEDDGTKSVTLSPLCSQIAIRQRGTLRTAYTYIFTATNNEHQKTLPQASPFSNYHGLIQIKLSSLSLWTCALDSQMTPRERRHRIRSLKIWSTKYLRVMRTPRSFGS